MERQEKMYQWIRIGRKWVLQLFNAYPDAAVSTGPYCIGWHNVYAKDKARTQRELDSRGYIPYVKRTQEA